MTDRKHNQNGVNGEAKATLVRAVKRIEKLAEEKDAIADEIGEEYKQLKVSGFDAAAVRKIVAERKERRKNEEKFDEREDNKDLYRVALGM